MTLQTYIDQHKARFLGELVELLKIPSVSADPKFKDDMRKAAEYVRAKIEAAGADRAEIFETQGHPVVYGEKIIDPEAPTVLIYGHYDVQPADPYELWDSPPFDPVIKNERIYARGLVMIKGSSTCILRLSKQ